MIHEHPWNLDVLNFNEIFCIGNGIQCVTLQKAWTSSNYGSIFEPNEIKLLSVT
jgi:hypothetical protein